MTDDPGARNSQVQITQLLGQLREGDRSVLDRIIPLVYEELHAIAGRQLRRERPDHTLNATALVNEAYLKLVDQERVEWQNRAHFFAIAAQAMRRILVNYANRRLADKRGGGEPVATLDESAVPGLSRAEDLVHLDEALTRLQTLSDRQSKVVEFRFFGGLTQEETAEVLGVSVQTVRLDWRFARAWLNRELRVE